LSAPSAWGEDWRPARLQAGHRLVLLQGGEALFPALADAMDAARQSVHLETYIFQFSGSALQVAEALVRAAAAAGADAVKLQTYTPDTLTIDVRSGRFVIGDDTIWSGAVLHDLYAQAQTPWEWHAPLRTLAHSLGLGWFSTPFDATAVDFLESIGAPAYKIASFELVDIPLLRRVAATGKPVVLSTGMATLEEMDEAVATVRSAGRSPLALLRTNSAYPAPPDGMHLRTIPALRDRYDLPIGLSDHTLTPAVAIAAVALGACIIEKHLTLSRAAPGPIRMSSGPAVRKLNPRAASSSWRLLTPRSRSTASAPSCQPCSASCARRSA